MLNLELEDLIKEISSITFWKIQKSYFSDWEVAIVKGKIEKCSATLRELKITFDVKGGYSSIYIEWGGCDYANTWGSGHRIRTKEGESILDTLNLIKNKKGLLLEDKDKGTIFFEEEGAKKILDSSGIESEEHEKRYKEKKLQLAKQRLKAKFTQDFLDKEFEKHLSESPELLEESCS